MRGSLARVLCVGALWVATPAPATEETRGEVSALFDAAAVAANSGRNDEAERSLQEVLRVLGEAGARSEFAARAHLDLGVLYTQTGRVQAAVTELEQASELFRMTKGERHPDSLGASANLAAVYRQVGRAAEAETVARSVLRTLERSGLPPDATFVQVSNTLANLAMERGDYASAAALYERALSISGVEYRATASETEALVLNLADAYEGMGDAKRAGPLLERALGFPRHAATSDPAARADLLERLAEQRRKNGELEGAAVALREAGALRARSDAAGGSNAAADLVRLAELELARGDSAAAEREIEHALALPDCGKDSAARAGALASTLAAGRQKQDQGDDAKRLYSLSLAAFERAGGPDDPGAASAAFNLGVLSYNANDDAAALGHFERALRIWRETRPAGDPKRTKVERLVGELGGSSALPDVGAGSD